ncbi:MAG: hypothetical protein ACJ75J_05650 [Cytophagaceae bacterium]
MATLPGAGGTTGGTIKFFLGLTLFVTGIYILLSSINVYNDFSLGYRFFSVGAFGITTGFIMIPFIFGVGIVFYNYKNPLGWALSIGSVACLIFGVIVSTRFELRAMNAFELISILVMVAGGAGLFISSLKSQ